MPLSAWKLKRGRGQKTFGRYQGGQGQIDIIDFLEIHENFYEIGGRLAEIHKKLKGAVAVIALQKNKGVDTGLEDSEPLKSLASLLL